MNPSLNTGANGIDFIFINTQETRQLTCNAGFNKTTINTCEDATSRIPLAEVQHDKSSGASVGAWFHHNQVLFEVISTTDNFATGKNLDDDDAAKCSYR